MTNIQQLFCRKGQMNCGFRLSLGFSTQIIEFEDWQVYKMFETEVLI